MNSIIPVGWLYSGYGSSLEPCIAQGLWGQSITVLNDRLRFAGDGALKFGKHLFQVGQRVATFRHTVFGTDSMKDEPVAGSLPAQSLAQTAPQLFPALVVIISLDQGRQFAPL